MQLTIADIRIAFRVVNKCHAAGADVYAWNQTLIDQLHSLFHSVFTASFIFPLPLTEIRLNDAQLFCERWEDPACRQRWAEIYAAGHLPQLPTVVNFFQNFTTGRTARRCDLVSDKEWSISREFREFRTACHQDDLLMSAYVIPGTAQLHCVTVNLPLGEQRFTVTQCELLQLIHEEILPLVGSALSLGSKSQFRTLPPRLKQVFELLMRGCTEQRIAADLEISKHTVHDYVAEIYRRFEVRSRRDLIAAAYQQGWKGY